MTDETSNVYNKELAAALGLDPTLDFMNDREDIKIAEAVIEERGDSEAYFKILTQVVRWGKEIQSWEVARIKEPHRRVAAIMKLLEEKSNSSN